MYTTKDSYSFTQKMTHTDYSISASPCRTRYSANMSLASYSLKAIHSLVTWTFLIKLASSTCSFGIAATSASTACNNKSFITCCLSLAKLCNTQQALIIRICNIHLMTVSTCNWDLFFFTICTHLLPGPSYQRNFENAKLLIVSSTNQKFFPQHF